MSQWEDQSLRDFVNSLGDTAVDLEPVGQTTQGQEDNEVTPETKKRRLLVVVGLVILLVLASAGTMLYLNHNGALSDEYNSARSEYEQLREDALDALADAEILAEECRNVIDDRAACESLDEAISDTESKSREIEATSPSKAAIEELKKATTELKPSLENLDEACARVEDAMGDSLGVYVQELIGEAQQSSASAHALLNQYQGTLENEGDGDDLKILVDRLDSTIDEARALLTGDGAGTLVDGVTPAEARDIAQALRQLIDDIADESEALRQSHLNFVNNQTRELQLNEDDSGLDESSPSDLTSDDTTSDESEGEAEESTPEDESQSLDTSNTPADEENN
ncbi:MAG: hypothetical protein IKS49_07795 [Actinomycetaceae bacterium]|nr:hypothetical protein [Actinomycetaceae bacterium]